MMDGSSNGKAKKKNAKRRTVQGLERPRVLIQQRLDAGEARLYVVAVALTVRSGACVRSSSGGGVGIADVVDGSRRHRILLPFF